jgi:hypothetical protein
MDNDDNKPLPGDVIEALKGGSKIEAIKLLRVSQGIDLKTAKEQVECYMDQNKDVFGSSRQRQDSSGGRFVFFVIVIVIAYAAYRYFIN